MNENLLRGYWFKEEYLQEKMGFLPHLFYYYFSTKTAKQSLTTARSAGEMKSLSKSIELWCKIEMFKPKFTQERPMLYGK